MIQRIVALCDAFSSMYGALDPKTDAYKARNPMMLKAFSPRHTVNEKGVRTFKSFCSGYDNGISDLKIKCSGKSFHKIGPDSTLKDLVCLYGNPATATRYVVNFLRKALESDYVGENTKLSWFLESEEQPKEEMNASCAAN